jgi:hypothetical protein
MVLFSLLFVPMTQGLSLATSGQTQAAMQQSLRQAMEQATRDLTEATYIYPPELIKVAAATSAYTGEHAYLVNYSTLSFISPAKDSVTGQPLQPLQPNWQSTPSGTLPLVTRYAVHTANTTLRKWAAGSPGNPGSNDKYFLVSQGPGEQSTFQLFKQQGFCVYDSDLGTYTFGSYADATRDPGISPGTFVIDQPNAENALTPRLGADIVCTRTVCRDNGAWVDGYVPVDYTTTPPTLENPPGGSGSGWTPQVVYLFDGIQFRPERISGEQLALSADGSTYRAQKRAWLGQLDDGTQSIYDLVFGAAGQWINSSELRPRLVVQRWDDGTSAYDTTVLDTDALDPTATPPKADGTGGDNLLTLRYNSRAGTVSVADTVPVAAQVNAAPGVLFANQPTDPGANFFPLASGSPRPDVVPEWPNPPASTTDARAPVGYVLDPWQLEGVSGGTPGWNPWSLQKQVASRDIKIVPGTVRVFMVWQQADLTTGKPYPQMQRRELAQTTAQAQDQIGMLQFTATPFDNGRQMELRFNPSVPPGPDLMARIIEPSLSGGVGLMNAQIQISYQARRNFDPTSNKDDLITVSYSTGTAYDVKLALSEYSPYQAASSTVVSETPFKPGAQILLSARLAVRNVGR